MKSEAKPYHLGCYPDYGICATGSQPVLTNLLNIPGAWSCAGEHIVFFPASREAFLAAEAVAAPEWMSDEYRAARAQYVGVDEQHVSDVRAWLKQIHAKPLLDHQYEFLAFAEHTQSVLNASEQGTGKTRMAWALARLWDAKRIVVACPKSLIQQWQDEFFAMWEAEPLNYITTVSYGTRAQRAGIIRDLGEYLAADGVPGAAIINYEMLEALLPELLKFNPDCVIFDESYRLKNRNAKVTRAATKLAHQATHKLLLTGTPVGNDIGDLWSQLRILDPQLIPDYWTFMRKYAKLHIQRVGAREIWKADGIADPVALMQLLSPVWFRATKEACLNLPPKQYKQVYLDLPKETRDLYDAVKKNGAAALGATLCLDGEQTTMIRLQQIAGGQKPVPLDERGKEWTSAPLDCPKRAWLRQFVKDQLAENPSTRAIVWCRFLAEIGEVTEMLQRLLGVDRVRCIHGEVLNEIIEEIKGSFNSRDVNGVQVIVAQVDKFSLGHNAQAADFCIYFSHTWSWTTRAQSEDRAHRHGREGAVQYVDLIARGTVDEDIMAAMKRKESLSLRVSPATVARKETLIGETQT